MSPAQPEAEPPPASRPRLREQGAVMKAILAIPEPTARPARLEKKILRSAMGTQSPHPGKQRWLRRRYTPMAGAYWLWVCRRREAQSRTHPAKRELCSHPPPSALPRMATQAGTERLVPTVLPTHSASLARGGTSAFRSPVEPSAGGVGGDEGVAGTPGNETISLAGGNVETPAGEAIFPPAKSGGAPGTDVGATVLGAPGTNAIAPTSDAGIARKSASVNCPLGGDEGGVGTFGGDATP